MFTSLTAERYALCSRDVFLFYSNIIIIHSLQILPSRLRTPERRDPAAKRYSGGRRMKFRVKSSGGEIATDRSSNAGICEILPLIILKRFKD